MPRCLRVSLSRSRTPFPGLQRRCFPPRRSSDRTPCRPSLHGDRRSAACVADLSRSQAVSQDERLSFPRFSGIPSPRRPARSPPRGPGRAAQTPGASEKRRRNPTGDVIWPCLSELSWQRKPSRLDLQCAGGAAARTPSPAAQRTTKSLAPSTHRRGRRIHPPHPKRRPVIGCIAP